MVTPVPVQPPSEPLRIDVPKNINWSREASRYGLRSEQLPKGITSNLYCQVRESGKEFYYKRADVLKLVGGTIDTNQKIQECFNLLFRNSQGTLIEKEQIYTDFIRSRNTLFSLNENRIPLEFQLQTLKELFSDNNISENLRTDIEALHDGIVKAKENSSKLYQQPMTITGASDYKQAIGKYLEGIVKYIHALDPTHVPYIPGSPPIPKDIRSKEPKDKQLGILRGIEFCLANELRAIDKYILRLKETEENAINQNIIGLNSEVQNSFIKMNQLIEGAEKEMKVAKDRGMPGIFLLQAFDTYLASIDRIDQHIKNKWISPEEGQFLKKELNNYKTRIQSLASSLKLSGKEITGMNALKVGILKSTKKGFLGIEKKRSEDKVDSEIYRICDRLLARAIVKGDRQSWKDVDGVLSNLDKNYPDKFEKLSKEYPIFIKVWKYKKKLP